jgi:hypothetical protein
MSETADRPTCPVVIEGCDRDGAEIDNTTLLAMWRSSMPIHGIAFTPTHPPPRAWNSSYRKNTPTVTYQPIRNDLGFIVGRNSVFRWW